ncbi:MAG: type I-F CRISPR-associated endoribonuclease Cas6/Csy4 [Marinospirillum sp.]|uniref:type I-F CRISPR-associated endoribonuclease Cas6/Csy4 n=1 Tax=Marinospirillum sp. TaxID=2183934 RepID=UPI0019DFEE07|nr:type I-F CRISPR-associated endoribonuclease Cas6/Csy4 [Marinospirillum sp.]MBE0509048.1 type I-F CRISPR-associated endoribonuclease Cas6/Csy4 [Marinospirillum sp.]
MDHYLDIHLLPDPEFTAPMLMGALYNKLHRALVALNSNDIGVSFPQYQLKPRTLGQYMRLHASASRLQELLTENWLQGMRDHVQITEIQPIPESVQHCVVSRRQFKTNADRLRRRRMQRKGESYEQATQAIPHSVERKPNLPFIMLRSQSTGQAFALFIAQSEVLSEPLRGSFNTYGLGQNASIPWF